MRDLAAAAVAVLLVMYALRMATSLTRDRRQRRSDREAIAADGRTILAEIPTDGGLVFFTDGPAAFGYGARDIPKAAIRAARVLINGAPIAAAAAPGHAGATLAPGDLDGHQPDDPGRDRWDVTIECDDGDVVLVPCGAIRERVSQELARRIFGAVKAELDART